MLHVKQKSNNQEQHQQFTVYSNNNAEGMSETISLPISQQPITSTSKSVSPFTDNSKEGIGPIFSISECAQEKKQSPPSSSSSSVLSSSEFSQNTVRNMQQRSNEGNPLTDCIENSPKTNGHLALCPCTNRLANDDASLLEPKQSLQSTNEGDISEKWHPSKIDPPNTEKSPLTQRLVIANDEADKESESNVNEEQNSQSGHQSGIVDDSELSDKMKIICKENDFQLHTNCENAKEQGFCSDDLPKPDSDGPSSLVNRQLLPCDSDEDSTEKTPTPVSISSGDLAVQKQGLVGLESRLLTSEEHKEQSLKSYINQGVVLGESRLSRIHQGRKINNGKKLSQSRYKNPLTNRGILVMLKPSLLTKATPSLRCGLLIFSCSDNVAEGIIMLPNAQLYSRNKQVCSSEHTLYWRLSFMTTACMLLFLKAFLLHGWKPTSEGLLVLVRCLQRSYSSKAVHPKFQIMSITTFNNNYVPENWKHLLNCRNNTEHRRLIPSNIGKIAETEALSVQHLRAQEHGTHTTVERRTLLTGNKQCTHNTAKTSLTKRTDLPNVWDRLWQITNNTAKQKVIVEKESSPHPRCILKVLHNSNSLVYQVTVHDQNDRIVTKSPDSSQPHLLSQQQREFDDYIHSDHITVVVSICFLIFDFTLAL